MFIEGGAKVVFSVSERCVFCSPFQLVTEAAMQCVREKAGLIDVDAEDVEEVNNRVQQLYTILY